MEKRMRKLRVIVENRQKVLQVPTGLRLLIRRCCHAVLAAEGFEQRAEVGITLVDDDAIRRLNNEHRHVDAVTDVLSFPLSENSEYDINPENGACMLGDVVLSVPRALEQANSYGHSFQREVGYLVVHSMLHLLGYDHVDGGAEKARMREREETIMQLVGLPRGSGYGHTM